MFQVSELSNSNRFGIFRRKSTLGKDDRAYLCKSSTLYSVLGHSRPLLFSLFSIIIIICCWAPGLLHMHGSMGLR